MKNYNISFLQITRLILKKLLLFSSVFLILNSVGIYYSLNDTKSSIQIKFSKPNVEAWYKYVGSFYMYINDDMTRYLAEYYDSEFKTSYMLEENYEDFIKKNNLKIDIISFRPGKKNSYILEYKNKDSAEAIKFLSDYSKFILEKNKNKYFSHLISHFKINIDNLEKDLNIANNIMGSEQPLSIIIDKNTRFLRDNIYLMGSDVIKFKIETINEDIEIIQSNEIEYIQTFQISQPAKSGLSNILKIVFSSLFTFAILVFMLILHDFGKKIIFKKSE